jgi:hypothetical protein
MQIFEPYDNPFWDFNNGSKKKKNKFPLAPMGVQANRGAHPKTYARPPKQKRRKF